MSFVRKIGVLTFHRCINYGSYWQARCLVQGLRARGHHAVLLDHDSPAVNRAEWKCALQPLLPARGRRSDLSLYALKTRNFFGALRSLPLTAQFSLDRPDELEPQDLIIVGSDEVWNLRHPWYGGQSIFYGEGLRAGRLASYAASFGNHDAADGLEGGWAERLRAFAFLSVRDENSRRLIRETLGCEPEIVLDPCLQFPPALHPATSERPPYVAVYGHSFPVWFGDAVQKAATAHGWRLLSIGYRNDWAHEQHIVAGPEEFARIIAGSVAVATNFFHGCVFALLSDRPFVSAPSDYRFNKVRDLAQLVGAERRVVAKETPPRRVAELLDRPLHPAIHQRIAALRRRSNDYLDHVLH